jgi:L-threonylcarbamoyladenylate synthase
MSASARILSTETASLFQAAVAEAAGLLRAGELVALPTETVYGLAANALDARAVARIFTVKGRPAHNPLIVHVAAESMARDCASRWPEPATRLAAAFWPGPLTLVLPKAPHIPDLVTAGGGTVGVRWPSHPFIQAVIRACGFPLAAPSANLANELSPTTAGHVSKSLGHKIPLIIDGGPSHVGIESTVLDLTTVPARVLRPGMIHAESLLAVLGADGVQGAEFAAGLSADATRRSPGLLPRHYSPKAELRVLSWKSDEDLKAQISRHDPRRLHVIAHARIPSGEGLGRISVIPHDPAAFARAIYAELHRCDEEGAGLIIVEAPPPTPEWRAIADRLRRAAG